MQDDLSLDSSKIKGKIPNSLAMYLLHSDPKPTSPASAFPQFGEKKPPGAPCDEKLWEHFRKGDESAFITIYREFANVLYNFGCQLTPDHDLVKDCLQEFFIYLREKRTRLGSTDAIRPYLFKAFKRALLYELKKQQKNLSQADKTDFTRFAVELSHETIYIHQQMESEQLHTLNFALQQLDAREREAIYYFYYEGMGYDEIASIFEFSHVSSARRLIYRGLAHLRKFFVAYLLAAFLEVDRF